LASPLTAASAVLVGVLACVALLGLLGGSGAHAEARARADLQAAISQIEACYATQHDYRQCTTTSMISSGGLSVGDAPGQVSAYAPSPTSYAVTATSSAPGPEGRGHADFGVFKDSTGMARTCNRPGVGGCSATGRW
jgi:type IV pilus assembly protein PilA